AAPVTSMTVAWRRAVTCAEARTAKNSAVARIMIALERFIPTPPADCDLHVRLIELPQLSRGKHINAPTRGSMAKLKMDHCFGMLDENLNAGAEGQRRQAC